MLYINLWSKILRYYWFESLLMIFTSLLFFFTLFQGQRIVDFSNKIWPKYQDDPYFTLMIESTVTQAEVDEIKIKLGGISEIFLLDREELRLKLYNKLKKQNIDFPKELLDREVTLLKVFLKNDLDKSMYKLVQEKMKTHFESSSYEMSEIKILRKSLDNVEGISFIKRWGKEVLLLGIFLLWGVAISFFYWRTYSLLILCQRFRFKKFVFEKFYLILFLLLGAFVVIFELSTGKNFYLSGVIQFLSFLMLFVVFLRLSNLMKRYSD